MKVKHNNTGKVPYSWPVAGPLVFTKGLTKKKKNLIH